MIRLIAEPDVSHLGNIDTIMGQIEDAYASGADFYKLQCFNVDKLGKDWQHRKAFYERCQLSNDDLIMARDHCLRHGIELIATVNDVDQAKRVWNLDIRNVKLPSGQVNSEMMDSIMPYDWDRIILSTGMSSDSALSMIHFDYKDELRKKKEVVIMHCVSIYPHLDNEVNLNRMLEIEAKFFPPKAVNFKLGYSDHSAGGDTFACLLAIAMGADYVEKHVHGLVDHSPVEEVACDWYQFKELKAAARRAELVMGDGSLIMQDREVDTQIKYEGRWNG